jgi:hypothetical protein
VKVGSGWHLAWCVLAGCLAGLVVGIWLTGLVLPSHVTATFLLGVLAGLALGAYLRWVGRQ